MKIALFFDQLQAGVGGKYDIKEPLNVSKGGIGSYGMFAQSVKDTNAQVICTVYCGSEYFSENMSQVLDKIEKLLLKLKIDVLICGPCFDFKNYAQMATIVAIHVQSKNICPSVVACSAENTEIIEQYKQVVPIVKMPKKGGIGLNQSLKNMVEVASRVSRKEMIEDLKEYLY